MKDDRPRDPAGQPVVKYRVSLFAALMYTVTMLVIYFLGQAPQPQEETRSQVQQAVTASETPAEPTR